MTIITGHLDKGDQSDYGKITNIPTKLVINHNYNINETKETIKHGSKSANNLQTWPFEPSEERMCFPRGLLEWVTEAKNVNSSYIFDLWLHVTAKRGNRSEDWFLVDHIITACVKEMSLGCCMQSFKQKNILLSLKMFGINIILNFVFWVT